MARAVLVGYDGSSPSRAAFDHALERCAATRSKLVLCNVVPSKLKHIAFSEMLLPGIDLSKLMPVDKFPEAARKRLAEVAQEARERGVEAEVVVRTGDAADELLAAAKEHGVEEVVLGYMSYEHKLPYGIGSVAEKVLRFCDRTVTIVRVPGAAPAGPPPLGAKP